MNSSTNYRLVEIENKSVIRQVLTIVSKKAGNMDRPGGFLWSLRLFFGLKTNTYKKSRIIRKYNKAFEEFVFKGYDDLQPDQFRPRAFKEISRLCKN